MPTGFTDAVRTGELTSFRDFAVRCSRAMGAAIHQRDHAPDGGVTKRTVAGVETRWVVEARVKLARLLDRTDEEWATAHERAIAEHAAAWKTIVDKADRERARYEAMLEQVEAWTPPTPDHEGLQKFMREQLTESIQWDCRPTDWRAVPETVAEYKAKEFERAAEELERAEQGLKEELDQVARQNAWVEAFYASLPAAEERSDS